MKLFKFIFRPKTKEDLKKYQVSLIKKEIDKYTKNDLDFWVKVLDIACDYNQSKIGFTSCLTNNKTDDKIPSDSS
ncbi:MAG: hypothetical protein SNJ71_07605 [Bacteroidales bacterium]